MTTPPTREPLKDRVYNCIDQQGIAPRARYWFLCRRGATWVLWVGSIALGGVALAVLSFAGMYRYYDFYEATHSNFVTFLIDTLPFVWLGVFALMLLVAIRQLRRVGRGYRSSVAFLAGTSVCSSVLLGAALYINNFGWYFDSWLGDVAPMYTSQAEREARLWQAPQQGRLMGDVQDRRSTSTVVLLDADNQSWIVFAEPELVQQFVGHQDNQMVRLFGAPTTTVGRFTACGVMPMTLKSSKPTRATLVKERAALIAYVDKMEQKIATNQAHPCHAVMNMRVRPQ
jgi:hypothetical protein